MSTAAQTTPTPLFTPEFAATFRDFMVESLKQDAETTKKVIAAVTKNDYKPDPHARTAWELAYHIATTDVWFLEAIAKLSFEGMMEKEKNPTAGLPTTVPELVTWYDKNFNAQLNAVRKLTPQQLNTNVDFYGAFNLQAFQYLMFLKSHSVHHRGQLASYLRPMGSKVPSIYGGSYDEPWQG